MFVFIILIFFLHIFFLIINSFFKKTNLYVFFKITFTNFFSNIKLVKNLALLLKKILWIAIMFHCMIFFFQNDHF